MTKTNEKIAQVLPVLVDISVGYSSLF